METIAPLLHYTVSDAVASLTRKRIQQNGPFLLVRPRSPLIIQMVEEDVELDSTLIVVRITSASWNGTVLRLPLTSQNPERNDWLAWGVLAITYGTTAHPALSGTTIKRRIDPSFATSNKGFPMKYVVSIPVSR